MGGYIGARSGTISATVANVQDVTATDSTPEVTIVNNTHEDTDGGREGKVIFKGQQSGGEESTLAEIQASHDGTADDEKGDLIFKTNDGSDGASPTEAMRITSEQRLGIGTGSPDYQLDLQGGATTNDRLRLLRGTDDTNQFMTVGYNHISTHRADVALASAQTGLSFNQVGSDGTRTNMAISSSGNVGIGINAPVHNLQIHETATSSQSRIQMTNGDTGATNGDGYAIAMETDGRVYHWLYENAFMQFATNNTERMRIASSGELFVGGFSSSLGGGNHKLQIYTDNGSGDSGIIIKHRDATGVSSVTAQYFLNNSGGTAGSITMTSSSVAYNTSSDHRLKENVSDISDGITRVKQLQPKRFNWIADESNTAIDGFLAHEAQAVVPEAVTGTHNEVDDNGNPVYQGIDQSKLVPLLTAALQEAIAKIETLETRVAALEAE